MKFTGIQAKASQSMRAIIEAIGHNRELLKPGHLRAHRSIFSIFDARDWLAWCTVLLFAVVVGALWRGIFVEAEWDEVSAMRQLRARYESPVPEHIVPVVLPPDTEDSRARAAERIPNELILSDQRVFDFQEWKEVDKRLLRGQPQIVPLRRFIRLRLPPASASGRFYSLPFNTTGDGIRFVSCSGVAEAVAWHRHTKESQGAKVGEEPTNEYLLLIRFHSSADEYTDVVIDAGYINAFEGHEQMWAGMRFAAETDDAALLLIPPTFGTMHLRNASICTTETGGELYLAELQRIRHFSHRGAIFFHAGGLKRNVVAKVYFAMTTNGVL